MKRGANNRSFEPRKKPVKNVLCFGLGTATDKQMAVIENALQAYKNECSDVAKPVVIQLLERFGETKRRTIARERAKGTIIVALVVVGLAFVAGFASKYEGDGYTDKQRQSLNRLIDVASRENIMERGAYMVRDMYDETKP